MAVTPDVIVIEVNETLPDMSSMGQRVAEAGAPAEQAKLRFAMVLRDRVPAPPRGLRELHRHRDRRAHRPPPIGRRQRPERAARRVVSAIARLPLHPDVAEGIRAPHGAGHRLVTLRNGSTGVAQRPLEAAGVRDLFEA